MDVSSVSKPVVQPSPAPKPVAPEQQKQGNEVSQKTAEPVRAQEPKPVVNSQGQVTGRLLNVSA